MRTRPVFASAPEPILDWLRHMTTCKVAPALRNPLDDSSAYEEHRTFNSTARKEWSQRTKPIRQAPLQHGEGYGLPYHWIVTKAVQHLFGLPDDELSKHNARRYMADREPGYPDRIEMRDAELGETLLLLNHTCQPADTPYRATHAIFVREWATDTYDQIDKVPEVMRMRLLSLRAFDDIGMMLDAEVIEGALVESVITPLFDNPAVQYLHVHNAKEGCYSGRIERN